MKLKLFVSYRSTDSAQVDAIVARLRALGYEVWQDKDSIPVGQDWWEAICAGIQNCDVFLFMLSAESVKSLACRAELSFAYQLNLPIIPFVLEGEWLFNSGGKHDIRFWDDVPDELTHHRAQFLFYEGVAFVEKLKLGIEVLLAKKLPRYTAAPPPDPRHATDASNNPTVIYDEACDFAQRGELATAETLFRKLVNRQDPIFGTISHQWVLLLQQYHRVKTMAERKNTRKIAQAHWETYVQAFPNDFLDEIFDPQHIAQFFAPSSSVITPSKPTSLSVMPQPFDWIKIPAGKGTLGTSNKNVILTIPEQAYWIGKYPVTNAQFAKFIEAGGYENERWWTEAGWMYRQNENWTLPRFWDDSDFNQSNQPVVGVSWYEAIAFCLWLSELTGEQMMLPTEAQWQYAAQGTDGRAYPWGNEWDKRRANSRESGIGKTSPVTQYEGKGDSPFGVVDMAGNVWEWCLTDYNNRTNDLHSQAERRVLRGGSWLDNAADLRVAVRDRYDPDNWDDPFGFRFARSL